MKKREIALNKLPRLPLTHEVIEKLSELCFRTDDKVPSHVHVLFIFGTSHSFAELKVKLNNLLKKLTFDTLIISGGIDRYQDSAVQNKPQSLAILDEIKDILPPGTNVHLEQTSQNTLENVTFSLKLLDTPIQNMCFIVKSFHAQRAYLTLTKYLPDISLYQQAYDVVYPEIPETFDVVHWPKNDKFISRVWGEFLRIKHYGERGDISYPPEIKLLIEELYTSLK